MNAEIVAGRLASVRNVYLRREVATIAQQIQAKHKDRLPVLDLVSTAAFEQVFDRQPLSLPDETRRDAVRYGLRYYELNLEKLRITEATHGLSPHHDSLLCPAPDAPMSTSKSQTDEPSSTPSDLSSTTIASNKADSSSTSTKKLLRTRPPKIILRRPSNDTLDSRSRRKPSSSTSSDRAAVGKHRMNMDFLSPTKSRRKKKKREKKQ